MLTIYEDVSQIPDNEKFNIAMTIAQLEQSHVEVIHYDINDNPDAFDAAIKKLMETEKLPITLLNGEVVKSGSYLTADEAGELIIVNQLNGIGRRCSITGKCN